MSKDNRVYLDSSSKVRKALPKKIPAIIKKTQSNTEVIPQHKSCTIPDLERFTDVFLPYARHFVQTDGNNISDEVRHERLLAYRAMSRMLKTRLSTASDMVRQYLTHYRQTVSECNIEDHVAPYMRRLHHVMTSAPTAPTTDSTYSRNGTRRRSRNGGSTDISRGNGETSKGNCNISRGKSEKSRGKSETSRCKSETSQCKSQTSQGKRETARCKSETSQCKSQTSRGTRETARCKSETSQCKSETPRCKSETSQWKSETSQCKSESSRGAVCAGAGRLRLASCRLSVLLRASLRLPAAAAAAAALYSERRAAFLQRAAHHLTLDTSHFTNIWNMTNTYVKMKLCVWMRSGMMTSLAAAHWRLLDFRVLHNDLNYNILKWPSPASLSALEALVQVVGREPTTSDWRRVAEDFRQSGRECSVVMLQYIWRQLLSLSHTHTYDVLQQVDYIRKKHGLPLTETRPYVRCKKEDEDFGETELLSYESGQTNKLCNKNTLNEQISTDDEVFNDQESIPDLVINDSSGSIPLINNIKPEKSPKFGDTYPINNRQKVIDKDKVSIVKKPKFETKKERNIDSDNENIVNKNLWKNYETDKQCPNKIIDMKQETVQSTSSNKLTVAMETDNNSQHISSPSWGQISDAETGSGGGYIGNNKDGCNASPTVECVRDVPSQLSPDDQTHLIKPWKKSGGGELAESALTRCWFRLSTLLLRGYKQKKRPDKLIAPPVETTTVDPLQEWIRQKNCNQKYFHIPGIEKSNKTTQKPTSKLKSKSKNLEISNTCLGEQNTLENDEKKLKKRKITKVFINNSNTPTKIPSPTIQTATYDPLNITQTDIIAKNVHTETAKEIGDMELIADKCDLFLNEELYLKSDIEPECIVVDCDVIDFDAVQSDADDDVVQSDTGQSDAADFKAVHSDVINSDAIDLDAFYSDISKSDALHSDALDCDAFSNSSTDFMVIDDEGISNNPDVTSQQIKQLPPLLPLIYIGNHT